MVELQGDEHTGRNVIRRPRQALRGLLLTGEEPHYLTSEPAGGHGAAATISTEPLWWPGGKIAAHHLGAYLAQARRE
jgi:hypothetical protein